MVLTNPEMLHGGLLPFHGRWATFLRRLRYVVVDELHVLRGIFGSHAGHVLRRLRRLCARYGASPTFVFSSATIGDPARSGVRPVRPPGRSRHRRRLATRRAAVRAVEPAAARRRRRACVASTNVEVAQLTAALVEGGWRTVAFCRSRRGTEVVARDVRRRLAGRAWPTPCGRTGPATWPRERREIEAELFSGRVQAVVATSALELGVDIGGLDACVLNGFPGTIASMWQQAGRAGRGEGTSLAVLVGGADQLDQWLMAHPREVFTRAARSRRW